MCQRSASRIASVHKLCTRKHRKMTPLFAPPTWRIQYISITLPALIGERDCHSWGTPLILHHLFGKLKSASSRISIEDKSATVVDLSSLGSCRQELKAAPEAKRRRFKQARKRCENLKASRAASPKSNVKLPTRNPRSMQFLRDLKRDLDVLQRCSAMQCLQMRSLVPQAPGWSIGKVAGAACGESKNCTQLWCKAHSQVKIVKLSRSTLGSQRLGSARHCGLKCKIRFRKTLTGLERFLMHAAVGRSTLGSQNCQNLRAFLMHKRQID